MKNYILVGLGPHAQRIYYPFLEKHARHYDIRLKLLIELEFQSKTVADFLVQRNLQPEKILYIQDNERGKLGTALDQEVETELNATIAREHIDGIIISTEPKAHKIYAEWALKNNVNVIMDKPITAPLHPSTNSTSANQIYEDYKYLLNLQKQSKAKFYIVCQRRNHEGYTLIKKYLNNFVREFNIPISYIDIYHGDGSWSLPHEFNKENHPYKYGYGKLMHSGYHFVDLFAWIAQTNFNLQKAYPNKVKIYTAKFTPNDLFYQLSNDVCSKFFPHPKIANFYKSYTPEKYNHFGELDAYILLQLMREGRIITTGTINLQQNSFSRRSWFDLPKDTYKGNGRVRHERANIQVSHFLNIQVHSYQSGESNVNSKNHENVGDENHFDIYIFRNKKIVGGRGFTKFFIGKELLKQNENDSYYLGHNEKAREMTLLNFIEGKSDESEFQYHDFTNQLLANIYASIAKEGKTGNTALTFKVGSR